MILLNSCDRRLTPKHVYRFEDVSVDIILLNENENSKEYRLIIEMIEAHVLFPGEQIENKIRQTVINHGFAY